MEAVCSIERTLAVLGERWTFLVLREAFFGRTRFAEFRDVLGVSTDVLSARLARLVEYGVLEKRAYQEPGSRPRDSYHLTPAGRELAVIMGALQQWGDEHLPRAEGPSVMRRTRAGGEPVDVAFVDAAGQAVAAREVEFIAVS
jgi:DNA-binding HxlR family transcriptional regulator